VTENAFAQIKKALQILDALPFMVEAEQVIPFQSDPYSFPGMNSAVQQLNHIPAGTVEENIDSSLVEKWNLHKNNSIETSFSPREIKKLCWIPELFSEEGFRTALYNRKLYFAPSYIRGLIYSYHCCWPKLADDYDCTRFLFKCLTDYAVRHRTIKVWLEISDCLIGFQGPARLASLILHKAQPIRDVISNLGLFENTNFVSSVATETVSSCIARMNRPSAATALLFSDYLQSPYLRREDLKRLFSELILSQTVSKNEELQNKVIDFVLAHSDFGDPRLHQERWTGVSDEARRTLIQWLSREEINVFFELLIRKKDDKHNRKDFWLEYVPKVQQSRALIGPVDRRRNVIVLQELEGKGRTYGELTGDREASAFILDFGSIVAVEFSQVNHACYLYSKNSFERLVKNFWAETLDIHDLKNQELAHERITRSMRDWQGSTRTILAKRGIRRA